MTFLIEFKRNFKNFGHIWRHICSLTPVSMIFGILGKFGIGIGNQQIRSDFFSSTKNPNKNYRKYFLVEKYILDRKNFDRKKVGRIFFRPNNFRPTFFRSKNFRSKIFFGQNFSINFFFSTKKFRPNKYFSTKNYFRQFFVWIFRRRKKIRSKIFGYLFRCEISPRFQKSYLEQRGST